MASSTRCWIRGLNSKSDRAKSHAQRVACYPKTLGYHDPEGPVVPEAVNDGCGSAAAEVGVDEYER
jgi:hypothetical protein